MYGSPKDTEVQLQSFLQVLARHRAALEQQREDIEVVLGEIAAFEDQCRKFLDGNAGASLSSGPNLLVENPC